MRGWKFVAADESAVRAKSLFDPIIVKDGQDDGGFANSSRADQGDRREVFCKTDHLVDQLVPPKEGPRWWWRKFPENPRYKRQTPDLALVENFLPVLRLSSGQHELKW